MHARRYLQDRPRMPAKLAEAIMTTDTCRKEIGVEFKIGTSTVRIGGICKGAGMIQPRLAARHATMLAFITTDVAIEPKLLKARASNRGRAKFQSHHGRWRHEHERFRNCVGEWACPKSETRIVEIRDNFKFFKTALNVVCLELAKMIVRDGEGASRFVTLHVHGARNAAEGGSCRARDR